MERQGDEVHVETDEARGGSTPNIVRWILAISLFAAIALLSIIWITGAATQSDAESEGTVEREVRDRTDEQATDSIVGSDADEFETAEPGEGSVTPTVPNEAAAEPTPAPTSAVPAN